MTFPVSVPANAARRSVIAILYSFVLLAPAEFGAAVSARRKQRPAGGHYKRAMWPTIFIPLSTTHNLRRLPVGSISRSLHGPRQRPDHRIALQPELQRHLRETLPAAACSHLGG